ncbi:uncharacterized protein IL334_004037 [Kwoniella shivajii]|uniref:NmrA-like domain-containing protein n=1 Tax=Kwoniella shivajii TaxID=564305 RepID=A0ABZ1D289_9TREE|nr:hypothetical protein IL334_004037 [Kwoniella shivajii]
MAPIVVGFVGSAGTVGKSTLPYLLEQDKAGKIKLVILHREGSDLSKIPQEVEKRVVQLDENGSEQNKAAVEGLEVLLSTIGGAGIKSQIYLVDALEGSKTLKSFIHSDFGTNWTAKELEAPGLSIIKVKEEVVKRAEEKKVPLTHIRTGAFDVYFFNYNLAGTDIKKNVVQVFRDSLKYGIPITSLSFLGYATTQLILKPAELPNQILQVYDFDPTGQEIIDVLTKLNGKAPEITHYTEEEYQKELLTPGTGAIVAAIKAKWGSNNFGPSEKPKIDGWKGQSFEELTKSYL